MPILTTVHAEARLQQRGIPSFILELLEACGTSVRCNGADRLIFDKAARRRLTRHLGGERNLRVVEPWLGVYAVIGDDGVVVTVAHATGRHRREGRCKIFAERRQTVRSSLQGT
jgi:hypothetical protein